MDGARRIVLSSPTTELVLTSIDDELPRVLHWGAPLGPTTPADLDALEQAHRHLGIHNGLPGEGYRVAVLPEQWRGWGGHPGVSGSRQGRDWAPRFTLTEVLLDGAPVAGDVTVQAPAATTWRAVDAYCGLALELELEMSAEGLVRLRPSLTNTGEDGYQLDALLVALPVPQRADEVLDLCGRWGKERVPQRSRLGVGSHWREGRHGRTGADSAFVLHLGEAGFGFRDGEVWSTHTAWSGNHVHYAERTLTGEQVIGGGELLLPGEVVLDHGHSYTAPWSVFGHGTGLDEIAHQHHSFQRATHPVDPQRPVTLNVWEAVYFDHDADRLVDLARRAAAVGIERFVLDDGWFGARRDDTAGLGDWVVSAEVWPQGLHPLVDEVHALGMQFGLWVEPEMVNPDSELARAHPEWVLQVPGRMPLTSRHQWVLDLGHPEAYAHVRDQLLTVLDEYDIAYLKWDHNRDLLDAGSGARRRPGVHAQTLAFYRLVDELKAAHPGLEVESCSSGGARVDLGVMEHCERVWVSDNIDPTDRQQIMRWTTQLLPPEYLGSHIASGASHTTGRHHELAHRAATAVFGHLGVEWDLAAAGEQELAQLGEWIAWYKANRATLNAGRLVRVDLERPGTQPESLFLHGVVTEERAIYAVTSLVTTPTWSLGAIPLPGLRPESRYRVSHLPLTASGPVPLPEPVELTGRMLATAGIRAPHMLPEHTRILVAERLA